MARKGDGVGVSEIYEHHDGCADCAADGRFEQEWDVPDMFTSLFLSALCEAHGAQPHIRKQRAASRVIVVRAREREVLAKVRADFGRLYPELGQALAGALMEFCESRLPVRVRR